MASVACIGECMVELRQAPGGQPGGHSSGQSAGHVGGLYSRGFGGDTLNTAVYLARLEVKVDYFTALGDDTLSDEMVAAWTAESIGTRRVVRLPGKLPGLYMIQTDANGERQFFHWRDSAAARQLMNLPETDELLNSLMSYDIVYLSAITLSIYDAAGRDRLFAAIKRARLLGTRFVFDTNFRARGWPDRDVAREVFAAAFAAADIVLTSTEDLLALYPGESQEQLMARIPSPELVFRLPEPVSLLRFPGGTSEVRAEPMTRPVIDTTAAGDSFAAAYIAARLAGSDPIEAAQAGHRLASLVICYAGAIIPVYAMPPKKRHRPAATRQASK
ncbi:sugar kinase [Bradyrhizobium diazoefficiens]|nr:sugar kinase [Bradyrhizobium diazoefficiens]UCF54181.1 MAG: sugar kinase [Bradyrhizobium sp.]MBR0962745.1 sugar kinase [Bradyrhizobium diazoefficiens]MBR0976905.1 sugar kinase [Bradyrhizobium diazoefficiens]MBR1005550.1 sugar kinase [Bradyrhizobium diazoefficiens]MBR1012023.1 sugar kinase [Bradyrhizobium diazoefficiens]